MSKFWKIIFKSFLLNANCALLLAVAGYLLKTPLWLCYVGGAILGFGIAHFYTTPALRELANESERP